MNRILLTLVGLMVTICGFAQSHENTTDHVSISALELTPGEGKDTRSFVVSLEGTKIYTAATMDIVIPEGYEIVLSGNNPKVSFSTEKKQGLYPVTNPDEVEEEEAEPAYDSHSLSSNIIAKNTVRVVVASLNGWNFANNSGKLFRVYVKATPFAKPGYSDVMIENCFFNTDDEIQWDSEDLTISNRLSASSSSSLPLSVSSAAQWGTCILPFDAEIPGGVKAYTSASYDEENVYLTEAESFEAYTPYVLYSENGYSGNLSGTVDANNYPENGYVTVGNLNGAIAEQSINSGYVLQKHDSGVKFFAVDPETTVTIPAGKCWMALPNTSGANFRNIIINEANGIQTVLPETTSERIFNLMGVRIQQPQRGTIYIQNGKKHLNTK